MLTLDYRATAWSALGSYVSLVVADATRIDAARRRTERLLDRLDRACSRFRPDADLVRANAAAGHWVRVDPMLVDVVRTAVAVAVATGGLVDPALGADLDALGYDRDLALVGPDAAGAPALRERNPEAWRDIATEDDAIRVPPGARLDLGAIGKAWAADRIAAEVPNAAGTSLVISLGGDVAVGNRPGERHGWQVAVGERPGEIAETVTLPKGGLATSSTVQRRWRQAGRERHHLLDPRTGAPVDAVWRTVSVCAVTCVDANAAGTAAIVLRDAAPRWLAARHLAARLVGADGRVLRVDGWPP